jgi:hypothetical protein
MQHITGHTNLAGHNNLLIRNCAVNPNCLPILSAAALNHPSNDREPLSSTEVFCCSPAWQGGSLRFLPSICQRCSRLLCQLRVPVVQVEPQHSAPHGLLSRTLPATATTCKGRSRCSAAGHLAFKLDNKCCTCAVTAQAPKYMQRTSDQ